MKDTSGFYMKLEDMRVIFANNSVDAPDFSLERSKKNTYTFPVNGWYWFDDKIDAYKFFGVPISEKAKI